MDAQILDSTQIRGLYEKQIDHGTEVSEAASIDPETLLSDLRGRLLLLQTHAAEQKLDKVAIDEDLAKLIQGWQGHVKNSPITSLDPFPDYIDPSFIETSDIPEIVDRIDTITGIKKPSIFDSSPKKEPNSRLEYIDLFDKYSDFQSGILNSLGNEESSIYEEVKHCDYLLTEFSRLESEAKANGKDTIILNEELQEKIREFQTVDWPKIKARNNLTEDRNPFSLEKDYSSIKTDDISTVKSRSSLVTSQLNQNLSQNVREIERVTRKLGHLIEIVSHFNNRDSFIDRCIRGQTQN